MKKNLTKKQITCTWIGILCSLCMVLSLVLAVPITASAEGETEINSIVINVTTDLTIGSNFDDGMVEDGAHYTIITQGWYKSGDNCQANKLMGSPQAGESYYYFIQLRADYNYIFPASNHLYAGGLKIGSLAEAHFIGNTITDPTPYNTVNVYKGNREKDSITIRTNLITPTNTSGGSSEETTPSGGTGTGNTSTGNETNTGTPHTHSFAWRTITEPTAEQDGLEAYACTSCGYYEESVPVSAYSYACNGGQNR